MDQSSLAAAQVESKQLQLAAQNTPHDLTNSLHAAAALSQQANEIGMTGVTGSAERLATVAGRGLLHTPAGMVETVKKEGVLGLATTAAESAVVGFGLKALMTKAAPVAEIGALALGTSFVAQTVPQFWDACAKGLTAKTSKDMDAAVDQFSQATGSLAVNSVIGVAGFKAGAGSVGLTRFAGGDALGYGARNDAMIKSLTDTRGSASPAADRVAPGADKAGPAPTDKAAPHDAAADAAAEVAVVKDRSIPKVALAPENTISMKELVERDPAKFEQVLDNYYPKLQNAFPDASEIESKDTYRDYLKDKDFPWDMLVLQDKAGNVVGGIQSQTVDVGGSEINKAIWGEHIWLAPEARTYANFQTLLHTAADRWQQTGADLVFMEFNDRAKMNLAQQNDDAAAGLTPEAREKIWGRVGFSVLGDETGRIAPYAQPAMGDGDPVEYLSLGMGPLKGTLDGKSIPIDDYLKLLRAAHATIPDVNLDTDPTVLKYTAALDAIKATGQDRLSFARLKDTEVLRLINQRFIQTKPPQG